MKNIFLALFSALLLILCFPRFDFEYLAWFALVPLLVSIRDKGLKTAFALCFVAGIIFYMGVFYWFKSIKGVSWFTVILSFIYLATSYFGLFGLSFNLVSKKTKLPPIVIAPVLWVSLEYARSNIGFLEFPWMLMGHSQYLSSPIIQISSITGVYGVSFLIVMVNVAISEAIHNRSKALKPIIVTIIVVGVTIIYSIGVIAKVPGRDTVSITVIQGNISQETKWKKEFRRQNREKHIRLTKEASNNDNTSLIVWPESALQGSFRHDLYLLKTISSLARETETHLLVGGSEHPKSGSREFQIKKWFNSAFLISPEENVEGQYNRMHLVPFFEYLPYKDLFPWLPKLFSNAGNFIPGTEYTLFNLNDSKFGVIICTESTFPEHVRQFIKNGANFMVNIINEGWFGKTSASYQLTAMSVFRAVENRTSIVRCANTGISCFINPHGKITGRVHDHNNKDTFVEGYLTSEISLSYEKTFYTKYGNIFIYMNLIMTSFMFTLCFFKSKFITTKPER